MKTDLDLYKTIRDAYEFQTERPHLSLVSSRLVGEYIALEVGNRQNFRKEEGVSFRAYVNALADKRYITPGERNLFHQLQTLGSNGAHNRTRNLQEANKAIEVAMILAKKYSFAPS